MKGILTPDHEDWQSFYDRLFGDEGCNVVLRDEKAVWSCDHSAARHKTARIMLSMGFNGREIMDSFDFFEQHEGVCDCAILFQVEDHFRAAKAALRGESVERRV